MAGSRLERLCRADRLVCSDVKWLVENLGQDLFSGQEVLVTGGAGFIGSWLVDLMYAAGADRIIIVDDFSTGDKSNIGHLVGDPRVEVVASRVEEYEHHGSCPTLVFHLAARPSPDDYMRHPVETLLVSSDGTRRALEIARRCDARFVLASTSEVYGDPEVIPTPEEYWGRVDPIGPRSAYDEGKRFAEALTVAYMRQYSLDARIARIFNTYGPRLDLKLRGYARVVTRFILQALRGEPITIHGDGLQTRSFLYIRDLVEAMAKLSTINRKPPYPAINIGSDREITILELARLIKKLTGSNSPLTHTPPRPGDPRRRRPDIRRAVEYLGWKPRTPLEEGLRRTIEWVKARLGA